LTAVNTELYIARRVFSQKGQQKGIASKIVSIAVASIALGLSVMIVSVAVLIGFKKEIREKVIGFGAHFQVVNYDSNSSFETSPIQEDPELLEQYRQLEQVAHIQSFATKPGMIKTDSEIHGMVLKGVDVNHNWSFYAQHLIDGALPDFTTKEASVEVIISEKISRLLQLKTGDFLYCYFYNEGESNPRSRRFTITGIYNTSMEEFDELFVVGDLRQVKLLYGWHSSEISGYEIFIHDYTQLEKVYHSLREITLNNASEQAMLRVYSIVQKYPLLFDWLSVLDLNVWVLLVLMVGVAGINMISGLLIVIIERSQMIGTLKALGYSNLNIRKIFLYLAAFLSIRGLIWGNVIGIGLCLIQYYTGVLQLDPESYYLDTVPVVINLLYIVLLNAGTLITIVGMILLPSMFISRISPVDTISFE
jgi:lipoprotein-releasing system permease protein